jgi:hypothetical protein
MERPYLEPIEPARTGGEYVFYTALTPMGPVNVSEGPGVIRIEYEGDIKTHIEESGSVTVYPEGDIVVELPGKNPIYYPAD